MPAGHPPGPDLAPEPTLQFSEVCDASAATVVGEHRLVVANDEDNILRVYDLRTAGPPIQRIDLSEGLDQPEPGREADLEGSATIGDITWWIGSHARNRDAKVRPNRCVLLATRVGLVDDRVAVEVVGAHHSSRKHGLLHALLHLDGVGSKLRKAEKRSPKARGGFNVEGLVADGGDLLIGLRNPIVDGHALVVRLEQPMALLTEEEPAGLSATWIDLGGLGIRSLDRAADGSDLIVVAGHRSGRGEFALFRWSGEADDPPRPLSTSLGELRVESLVSLPDGTALALSDDGAVRDNGVRCKDRPPLERYFRGRRLRLDEG